MCISPKALVATLLYTYKVSCPCFLPWHWQGTRGPLQPGSAPDEKEGALRKASVLVPPRSPGRKNCSKDLVGYYGIDLNVEKLQL